MGSIDEVGGEEEEALEDGEPCPQCEDGVLYHIDEHRLSCDSCGFDVFTTEEEDK